MIKKFFQFQNKHFRKILIIDAALIIAAVGGIVAFSEPAPVQGLRVEQGDYSSVHLTWKGSKNADGYRVYRSDDGKDYHYLESTVDNKFRDVNLRTGNTYYYTVAARNGFKKSEVNKKRALKVVPKLEQPKLSVDTSKGNVELKISDVEGAIAYEISRDGKKIAESMETVYVDNEAVPNKPHKYEVKAVRYKKDPVYSAASKAAKAELYGIQDLEMRADSEDVHFSWTGDEEHYDQYKLYNGDELLTETTETEYTLTGYDIDKIYDIKLQGVNIEKEIQSPALEKKIKVMEEPLDNEGARQAACDWGVMIAEDNSFTYGTGNRAHRCGCYFCGTNGRKGSGYSKTYCCNPFVNACYAHGAGDPQILRTCQKGDSVGMYESDYTRYGNWERHSKSEDLEMGDVLVGGHHVMLYIGDDQVVHAAQEGWDAGSISVDDLASNRRYYDFVMRYTGTGSGTMYKVREVDDKGKPIDTEKSEEEATEKEESADA